MVALPDQWEIISCGAFCVRVRHRVIYEPLTEGGFQVIVPALPGIVTYGRTLSEAREMARDAIVCHLQGLLKDDEEIPEDPFTSEAPVIEELKVAV